MPRLTSTPNFLLNFWRSLSQRLRILLIACRICRSYMVYRDSSSCPYCVPACWTIVRSVSSLSDNFWAFSSYCLTCSTRALICRASVQIVIILAVRMDQYTARSCSLRVRTERSKTYQRYPCRTSLSYLATDFSSPTFVSSEGVPLSHDVST